MTKQKLIAFLLLPFPSFMKVLGYRYLLGYQIGKGVRIGFSVLIAGKCRIGERTVIGNLNYIAYMQELSLGEDVRIGHVNILLGGRLVEMGDGATIGRFNEINSILTPLARGHSDPVLTLGQRAVVTAWHKIDFTDRVTLEESVVLAGRVSNLWTHNRQDVAPVRIGAHSYVGSGIQMVPGSSIGRHCVVGLGSVITKAHVEEGVLLAGVPAKVVKQLDEETLKLVTFPTRPDLDGSADLVAASEVPG
jgi:acetyltransferase-like isoleucine patch superfamily enzyme